MQTLVLPTGLLRFYTVFISPSGGDGSVRVYEVNISPSGGDETQESISGLVDSLDLPRFCKVYMSPSGGHKSTATSTDSVISQIFAMQPTRDRGPADIHQGPYM